MLTLPSALTIGSGSVRPRWVFSNGNVLWATPQANSLVFCLCCFRQLDAKLMTFAINRGRNKSEFITKVQLHQNCLQCVFVLRGCDGEIFAARVFCHVVHDFSLLADYEAQVRGSRISYPEHDARRLQKII